MKRAILISTIVVLGFNLYAQKAIDNVLTNVEKNNITLLAYRKSIEVEKIGNKIGLAPQNPEAEFNYLWGNPTVIGNRTDFSIKQSFDFPTTYSYKNQISNLKNEQAELEYKKKRLDLFFQTRVVCAKLTYYNALKVELSKRLAQALVVAKAYKTKYNTGDVSVLDYNKAQVNLLNIFKEQENNEIERNALLSELTMLNGGHSITFSDSLFSILSIPADFEQWFSHAEVINPLLQWLKQEIIISEKQVKLNTASSLPKLFGGFMSEKVVGQKLQGISIGITVPLWENKNMVKYAKANTIAMQSIETNAKFQFYNRLKIAHSKAISLQHSVSDYRLKLALYSNTILLEKAFNKGEISLTEYMYELSLYYQNIYKLLEMEMKLNIVYAELINYQH